MIQINTVKNTVMFLLSKFNKGSITPMSFDSFAELAQRDIFESLFYDYNDWLINHNKRVSNTGYADLPAMIQEHIDVFSEYSTPSNFTYDTPNNVWKFSGTDFYRTMGLTLINATEKRVDVELVMKQDLNNHINSTMTGPTTTFPIYVKLGENYRTYPVVPAGYSLELFYIRVPKRPHWSYVTVGGNPVFDGSANDLQNFELSEALFPKLVVKILGYCGVSLKESEVVQEAAMAENAIEQKQNS